MSGESRLARAAATKGKSIKTPFSGNAKAPKNGSAIPGRKPVKRKI